jgi:hypothetical protein
LKASKFFDINCSKCGRWASSDWSTGNFNSEKACLIWAKKMGWKTIKGDNYCIGCILEPKIIEILEKRYKNYQIQFYPYEMNFLVWVEGVEATELIPLLSTLDFKHVHTSMYKIKTD